MLETIKRVREEKGGFTLAELLIVVAIILVLVAIAIPVFTGALGQADKAVADGNIRSVKAAATTEILTDATLNTKDSKPYDGPWKATAKVSDKGDVTDLDVSQETGTVGTDEFKKETGEVTVYVKSADTTTSTPTPPTNP